MKTVTIGVVPRSWYVRAFGVVVIGAAAGLLLGGVVILFLGAAVVSSLEKQGQTLDQSVWIASLILGPLLSAACTGATALVFRWPPTVLRRPTAMFIAASSGIATFLFLVAHPDGSIRFIVQPWWWAVYVVGVVGATAAAVRLWLRRYRPISEDMGRRDLSPGWYPDPFGQARLRWWDGTQWTAHEAA